MTKFITVVTACFNEEGNIEAVYQQTKNVMASIEGVEYEHLFIDNCSTDNTPTLLRALAQSDPKVKVIFNSRNFGHIRSPYHALMQARGDAVISLVADLQDPPGLIAHFIQHWLAGAKIVAGIKESAKEPPVMFALRRIYYKAIASVASIDLIQNFTGFGLYDRQVLEALREMNDPYPYFRGMISEVGFEVVRIPYSQPLRNSGKTKNNFFTLFDLAMLGLTSHSRAPLRVATLAGFLLSAASLVTSMVYLALKLLYWSEFTLGTAPLLIGMFFFASVQLFFIGLLGEYVGSILTYTARRPLVVEKERLNF